MCGWGGKERGREGGREGGKREGEKKGEGGKGYIIPTCTYESEVWALLPNIKKEKILCENKFVMMGEG